MLVICVLTGSADYAPDYLFITLETIIEWRLVTFMDRPMCRIVCWIFKSPAFLLCYGLPTVLAGIAQRWCLKCWMYWRLTRSLHVMILCIYWLIYHYYLILCHIWHILCHSIYTMIFDIYIEFIPHYGIWLWCADHLGSAIVLDFQH